ncbi:hypothetical protein MBLNU230_g0218t1 [Neophaeotheca triangularis]
MSTPQTGHCHCGLITITIPSKPTQYNACRCTICHAYGAWWSYYNPADVNVDIADGGERATYQCNAKVQDFCRCARCGSVYSWERHGSGAERMGVNMRMFAKEVWEGATMEAGAGP